MTKQPQTTLTLPVSKRGPKADLIHDLRTPVQAILAAVEQINRNPQPQLGQHLDLIRENSRILLAQVDQLQELTLSKPEQKTQLPAVPAHKSRVERLGADPLTGECVLLQKLRQIILAHLKDEQLGPQTLCREMGMSRTQLYRKMKELALYPVAKYIRLVRLCVAHELLETTSLGIGQVAHQVGFNNQSYFSKTFLEEFGIRPSEVVKNQALGQ